MIDCEKRYIGPRFGVAFVGSKDSMRYYSWLELGMVAIVLLSDGSY